MSVVSNIEIMEYLNGKKRLAVTQGVFSVVHYNVVQYNYVWEAFTSRKEGIVMGEESGTFNTIFDELFWGGVFERQS